MTVVRDLPREYVRAMRKCTPTQRKWLRELQACGFRPYRAQERIRASHGSVTKWRRLPQVQEVLRILNEIAEADLVADQAFIREQYQAIAGANLKDLVDENGHEIPLHQLPDYVGAALAERTVDANGRVKYKFHPKAPALEALANMRNLAKPKRVELTGKDGADLIPPTLVPDDAEIARRLLFLLTKGTHAAS